MVKIYTSGSCGNSTGGWAYLIEGDSFTAQGQGHGFGTTKQRMEIIAVIRAFEDLHKYTALEEIKLVILYTDSSHVQWIIKDFLEFYSTHELAQDRPNSELWKKYLEVTTPLCLTLEVYWAIKEHREPKILICENLSEKQLERGL